MGLIFFMVAPSEGEVERSAGGDGSGGGGEHARCGVWDGGECFEHGYR